MEVNKKASLKVKVVKPLTSLKNRMAKLDFAKKKPRKKNMKKAKFWKDILWTDETKVNLYDGKKKYGEGVKQLMIQSKPHQL